MGWCDVFAESITDGNAISRRALGKVDAELPYRGSGFAHSSRGTLHNAGEEVEQSVALQHSTDVAIKGVSGAIAAYHEGNLEMAGNAQMMASAADFPKELPKADDTSNPVPLGDE